MKPRFCVYAHYAMSMHMADFDKLPGVPNYSPGFSGGNAPAYTFGGIFDYTSVPPVDGVTFFATTQIYVIHSATLRTGFEAFFADAQRFLHQKSPAGYCINNVSFAMNVLWDFSLWSK